MWEKLFAPLHCLNLGIAEDETQNVLWRIENGEIDSTDPKVCINKKKIVIFYLLSARCKTLKCKA